MCMQNKEPKRMYSAAAIQDTYMIALSREAPLMYSNAMTSNPGPSYIGCFQSLASLCALSGVQEDFSATA